MEKVKDQNFYHIQRNLSFPTWSKGDSVSIGQDYNKYYDNHINSNQDFVFQGANYQGSSLNDIFHNIRAGNINVPESDMRIFLDDLNKALEFNLRLNRETIFEKVRIEMNPELPSRMKCLFLVPNSVDNSLLRHWYNELGSTGLIYKLKVNGVIHTVDSSLVNLTTRSPMFIKSQAEKYWGGTFENINNHSEILFSGSFIVEEVLSKGVLVK